MKILGHTATGYIVHIDQKEMQALTGALEQHYRQFAWPVGREVSIVEAWKYVKALVDSVSELRDAGARLQALADLLREQPERLQALMAPQKGEEEWRRRMWDERVVAGEKPYKEEATNASI